MKSNYLMTNRVNLNFKLALLCAAVIIAAACYQLLFVNWKFLEFTMTMRAPKIIGMVIAAFCIGSSSLVFQTLINNTIITPCLLGMNALYLLLHTALVFAFGIGSFIVTDKNLAFFCDLGLMAVTATYIYSYMFKKTRYNVLYVLLIGTVMTTFFTSLQSSLVRSMDPNDYDTLLTTLVASFSNVNSTVLLSSAVLCALASWYLRLDLKKLDVLTLGRSCASSLGVDYDRTVKRLLLGVTIYIAIATALVGPISFMGLITTNLARQLFKTFRHSYLVAGSVLISMLILITGQLIIERIFVYSVPISVFITIGGGIYFLFLLLCSRKSWI